MSRSRGRREDEGSPRRGRGQIQRGMTDSLMATSMSRSLRSRKQIRYDDDDESSEEEQHSRKSRRSQRLRNNDIDDMDEETHDNRSYQRTGRRSSSRPSGRRDTANVIRVDNDDSLPRRSRRVSSQSSTGNDSTPGSMDSNNDAESKPYHFRDRSRVRRETYNATQLGGEQDENENENNENEVDEDTEDDDDEEEEEEEEEEEVEEEVKKYTFRNRSQTRRQLLNIDEDSTLNQSYTGEEERSHLKSSVGVKRARNGQQRSKSDNFSYKQKRMHLGGRLPSPPKKEKRKNRKRDVRRDTSRTRRHYDSSSESSSSSSDSSFRKENSRRRYRRKHSISDEDENFREHEQRREARERASIAPLNLGNGNGMKDEVSRRDLLKADVLPLQVDAGIGFDSVGGLDSHLRALKEMVILPLLYPDVFQHFDTQPPRGVLFSGPPGCGKTLTARALANSLSASSENEVTKPGNGNENCANMSKRKVSFFMRKGADCLSKWLGEGERQLRLLFEQARRHEPSIIFFDEIDGLAPVRSVKQDQIHASIVSTLLALMDGLDSRGQVVVIGATNRPDAIDPALRRPGRFDRELVFPLPDSTARRAILDIHTKTWDPPLVPDLKEWIIDQSVGYCGADIKALCAEATIMSLRRAYPQVYASNERLDIKPSSLRLSKGDFASSFSRIVPASRRASSSSSGNLSIGMNGICSMLLKENVNDTLARIRETFPPAFDKKVGLVSEAPANKPLLQSCATHLVSSEVDDESNVDEIKVNRGDKEEWLAALTDVKLSDIDMISPETAGKSDSSMKISQPPYMISSSFLWDPSYSSPLSRVMLTGLRGMCLPDIAAVALHHLTSSAFPMLTLELTSLFAADENGGGYTPEQTLSSRLLQARHLSPSVIYFPDVLGWWSAATEAMKIILVHLMESTPMNVPILWLSTIIPKEDSGYISEGENRMVEDSRLRYVLSWLSGADALKKNQSEFYQQSATVLKGIMSGESSLSLMQPHLPCQVRISLPSREDRELFFEPFFLQLPSLPLTLLAARKKMFESQNQQLATSASIPQAGTDTTTNVIKNDTMYISDKDRERDRHYFREQRLFFRAALAQLLKEKRFTSLSRPVDPEQVPDYYDIVMSPMDLETMRDKVDAHLYPTYDHFIYDIQQIVHNAKRYNPTEGGGRGKSIISAANQMVDAVESHAYHNVQIMKYNVFKKCEEAYYQRYFIHPAITKVYSHENESKTKSPLKRYSLRQSTTSQQQDKLSPAPFKKRIKKVYDSRGSNDASDINYLKQHRNEMPSENFEFYEHVLQRHQDIKNELFEANGIEESNVSEASDLEESKDTMKGDHEDWESINGGTKDTVESGSNSAEQQVEQVCVSNEKIKLLNRPYEVVDLASCPLMLALKLAASEAKDMSESKLPSLLQKCMRKTEGWSVAQLISLYTKFNRAAVQFQGHANWKVLIKEIEHEIQKEV